MNIWFIRIIKIIALIYLTISLISVVDYTIRHDLSYVKDIGIHSIGLSIYFLSSVILILGLLYFHYKYESKIDK